MSVAAMTSLKLESLTSNDPPILCLFGSALPELWLTVWTHSTGIPLISPNRSEAV